MIHAMKTFVLLCLLVLSGVSLSSKAQTQEEPPFLLVPADGITAQTHLILTVPITDRSQIDATAAAIEARFGVTLTAEWPLKAIAVHCFVVDAGSTADMDTLIARMRADKGIRTVQRMQTFGTLGQSYADPLFPIQSALRQINAIAAQRFATGSGVKVAVVDSAIDMTHPDLRDRLAPPRDFVDPDASTARAEDHGTAIAGIIAAEANDQGIVGIAPMAELTSLRACWQDPGEPGHCNSFSLARALNFAILNDFDIINMSLGGPSDPLLEELVLAALKKDIVVVAAWGDAPTAAFPASVPGILAAGGKTDESIPAPSIDVISTAPHDDYRYVSGSSVATAHVTGVAALLRSLHPGQSPDAITKALHHAVTSHDGIKMLDACVAMVPDPADAISCAP